MKEIWRNDILIKLRRYIIKRLENYKEKLKTIEFKKYSMVGNNTCIHSMASIRNESGEASRVVIGNNCHILGEIICKNNGYINIGNYTTIQDNVSLMCLERIEIGSFVGIAYGTVLIDNNNHSTYIEDWIAHRIRVAPGGEGYPGLGNGWEYSVSSPICIKDGVWIGNHCSILKGVTIGEGAIIARCSVVTNNVEPYTVVAGNPAKKVKDLKRSEINVIEISNEILHKK